MDRIIATKIICTPTGTISDIGTTQATRGKRTKWKAPLRFSGDTAAPKCNEVGDHKTKNIYAHLFDDGDAFLALMRGLHVPDRSSCSVASVAYACNESTPDLSMDQYVDVFVGREGCDLPFVSCCVMPFGR